MYHSGVGGVSVGAGGVLAATGFWATGYAWAAAALIVVGLGLMVLVLLREHSLRKRLAARRTTD